MYLNYSVHMVLDYKKRKQEEIIYFCLYTYIHAYIHNGKYMSLKLLVVVIYA